VLSGDKDVVVSLNDSEIVLVDLDDVEEEPADELTRRPKKRGRKT
jgi:hypothetical protein